MKNTKYLYDESMVPKGMVSVSQIQTFLSCRKKWEYNYIDDLKPRIERSYLTIGKLCHKGMQTAMQKLWECPSTEECELVRLGCLAIDSEREGFIDNIEYLDEELPEFEQLLEDAKSVFSQALEEFNPTKYEVVEVCKNGMLTPALELHFRVPCPPTKGLHGYIDAILRDKETGFIWCVDYKFRKSLSPDEDEAFNIQNAVYAYACKKMDIDITGTMTWQHVNTPAVDPKVNKDGSISTAKVRTTWHHYKRFCAEHGQNPDDYASMEDKLSEIEWYRGTYEYRNNETIEYVWDNCVKPVARDIRRAHGTKADNYRSLYPWNCKMCQYQSLCQAEIRGYDVGAIVNREYVRRER